MSGTRQGLAGYLKWVMRTKGLSQKDVERISGGRITGGYVATIASGRARNVSVDKLKALADGIGVDVDELFYVASGRSEDIKRRGKPADSNASMILETIQKALGSPDVIEILRDVVYLSPQERISLLAFIKRLGAVNEKPQRKAQPE